MRRSARLEEYVQGRRHEVDWGAHMSTPLLPEAVLEIDANSVSLLGEVGVEGDKIPTSSTYFHTKWYPDVSSRLATI